MTYNDKQQKEHRAAFINECRQKAWGAACHADWISKSVDELMERYKKLQDQDREVEAEIKALAARVDYHAVENREGRKKLQGKRDELAQEMELLAASAQQGQKALNSLLQSVETNLALAEHAETWEWKEIDTQTKEEAGE